MAPQRKLQHSEKKELVDLFFKTKEQDRLLTIRKFSEQYGIPASTFWGYIKEITTGSRRKYTTEEKANKSQLFNDYFQKVKNEKANLHESSELKK